jgi:hypothetical protein
MINSSVSSKRGYYIGRIYNVNTRQGVPHIFQAQARSGKDGGKRGSISGFPFEQINKGFQVPLRAEHFVIEFVTPGAKAEFENLMDDAIRVLRPVEFDQLVKEIIRDPNGVHGCAALRVLIEVLLYTLENSEVNVLGSKFFIFHFRHPLIS